MRWKRRGSTRRYPFPSALGSFKFKISSKLTIKILKTGCSTIRKLDLRPGIEDKPSFYEQMVLAIAWVVIFAFPLFLITCPRKVKPYQKGLIFRFGKLRSKKAVDPGWKFTNVFVDDIVFIDVRPFEAKISAGSFMSLGNRLSNKALVVRQDP